MKLSEKLIKIHVFPLQNAFENVWKMTVISSQRQCVKAMFLYLIYGAYIVWLSVTAAVPLSVLSAIMAHLVDTLGPFNTLRPRQNGLHFTDYIVKCIFLNENVGISITISLKFVLKNHINNISALAQIMARRWPGNKTLLMS